MQPKYIMIGGFLGAGKTTLVARMARHYLELGKRVGIVTNDQTDGLVDTHSLRRQGFAVGEVSGSCFCCNFSALTDAVEQLGATERPEIILAEPVGSCTDLVATVIRPLMQVYGKPLDVAPYGVILKPSHGRRILRQETMGGFSPQAEYIFRKQLEEADFVLINRVDQLSADDRAELAALVERDFPDRPVLGISALTGEGFPPLIDLLEEGTGFPEQSGGIRRRVMEVDYETYAQGEADLGWLNGQVTIRASDKFDLDALLLDVIRWLHARFLTTDVESAHLKIIGMHGDSYGVANLVSNSTSAELSLPAQAEVDHAELVINARVATDPALLQLDVESALSQVCQSLGAEFTVRDMQSFQPGRPVPTHRIVEEPPT